MRIYIKEIRDDFSEKIILGKRSEGWVGFKLLKMVVRAFQVEEQPMKMPCGRKALGVWYERS